MRWWVFLALVAVSATARAEYKLGYFSTYEVSQFADAVAIGDVTGDGLDDIVLTTKSRADFRVKDNFVYIFVQQADGLIATPQRYTVGTDTFTTGLALADMDNDGIKDIVVGRSDGIRLLTKRSLGHRSLIRRMFGGGAYWSVKTMDVDMDGNMDVVAWGGVSKIFFGDGHGGIRETRLLPMTAAAMDEDLKVGDLNGDGFPDLAYGHIRVPFSIRFNDRAGGFRDPVVCDQYQVDGFALGDYNPDGRLDIAGANLYNGPVILLQQPGEIFQPSPLPGWETHGGAMTSADVNGDGRDDLLIARLDDPGVDYYLQGATGLQAPTLAVLPFYTTGINPAAIATGDLDHDGCADVAVANDTYGLNWMYGAGCTAAGVRSNRSRTSAMRKSVRPRTIDRASTAHAAGGQP